MSCPDLKRKNAVLEEKLEHDKLKRYLNDLLDDNNVCRFLAKREIELGDHAVLVRTISKIVDLLLPKKKYFSKNVENY